MTTHTVTIEGRILEPQIWRAIEAAREAGATHYAIGQAHPHDPSRRWIAAKGRVAGAMTRPVGRGESDDSEWTR